MKIFTIIAILIVLIVIYLVYRNERTYRTRVWFIENDHDGYRRLPHYDSMLYSFKPLNIKYWQIYLLTL